MSIAPFHPIRVPFGTDSVLLRSIGDEFYSRLETLDGYTVLMDSERSISYACLKDGRFASTGVSIAEPPPTDIPKHLQENVIKRRDVFAEKFRSIRKERVARVFGPDAGLLIGRKRSSGTVRGLTIIVEFSDVQTAITRAEVDDLMNKPGYSLGGNLGSVRDYYLTMSSGKLDYSNDVIGPIRLQNTKAYYDRNLLCDDALKAAIQQAGLDLSKYATQLPDELAPKVDAINFLYAGESVFNRSSSGGWLWPHNSSLGKSYHGVDVDMYMLTGLGDTSSSMSIGTICHETGHLLCCFPDLYDYGNRDEDSGNSEGIGQYCLMGSGNHLASGRVPAPICGYLRKLAKWVDNVVEIESGKKYELQHGQYSTIHLHNTSRPVEYFIIENRSKHGYDKHLPDNGLAVLHCDIYGSNEWQNGEKLRHYQCALLQADGRRDLEQDRNRGDADDMFSQKKGVFLSAETTPHSREWSGADSGLILRDLEESGMVMNVSTGKPPVSQGATMEAWPRVTIPDNDANGVSVTLKLPSDVPANTIAVKVEILHSYRGDLIVELTSPAGKTARLWNAAGGSADNLSERWASDSHVALAGLTDASGAGIWTLKVADTAKRDIGTLEYVAISCS